MKKSFITFVRMIILLIGITALVFMLWEPHLEGRNAHSTLFEIYFKDPFLAYAYIGSIPFFVALSRAFKALKYAGHDAIELPPIFKALKQIRFCAMVLIGFVAGGEIIILMNESDDRAGGVVLGILIILGSIVVAVAAAMFERHVRHASDVKSVSVS